MSVGEISLAVIAGVYLILAIAAVFALVIVAKLYSDLKGRMDELKKEVELYANNFKDVVYKAQQIMDAAKSISEDAKGVSQKAKDTTVDILDTTKDTADKIVNLADETRVRTKKHINYLFDRVGAIEEKLDTIYIYLTGVTSLISKFTKRRENE